VLSWLHSLLPQLPHFGYALVFIVVFLNNIGLPVPGETFLLAAGFILGRSSTSLWEAMVASALACFLGGICAFWMGQRLGHTGLGKIRWLHLTPKALKWPERFFKRYGPKSVFIARFIFLLPPATANVMAGMAKMPWRTFLFYNATGSTAYSVAYILAGYYFGKQWKQLQASLGPTVLYSILTAIALVVLGVIFRESLSKLWTRLFSGKRK
jgi:membrane protein DedA with SNARE-associated domain